MITQIYEISTESECDACLAAGVDHIGVLVGDGTFPRELSPRAARGLLQGLRCTKSFRVQLRRQLVFGKS